MWINPSRLPWPFEIIRSASLKSFLNSSLDSLKTVDAASKPFDTTLATSFIPTYSASSTVASFITGAPLTA